VAGEASDQTIGKTKVANSIATELANATGELKSPV
jgi:hypothetical protein